MIIRSGNTRGCKIVSNLPRALPAADIYYRGARSTAENMEYLINFRFRRTHDIIEILS